MDFILSLTHFCEVHGPKSVLCTQVLPLECAQCLPPALPARPKTPIDNRTPRSDPVESPGLQRSSTNITLPSDFSRASTTTESVTVNPTIEKHPLFVPNEQKQDSTKRFRYGKAQGESCASCSFSVPQEIAAHIPDGAPGSLNPSGKGKNGSPVLRSREVVCFGDGNHNATVSLAGRRSSHVTNDEAPSSSFQSDVSADSNCHDHRITYLTSRSPDDPTNFSTLRASVIRTLSCELLPRGMSDGPLCFGDSRTGYTIAYVFRLTDPKARGRRRAYAFVALAGTDASRAFRACPMVWEAFTAMAQAIEEGAQRSQDQQKQREEEERELDDKSRNYTPISSFLTQRTVDPDGFPRRAGQVSPRSLAEIVGDENIFALLHQYFVAILRRLGDRFGGIPVSENGAVYQTTIEEKDQPKVVHTDMVHDTTKDVRSPSKNQLGSKEIEAAIAKLNISNTTSLVVPPSAQCGPLPPKDSPSGPQVVV